MNGAERADLAALPAIHHEALREEAYATHSPPSYQPTVATPDLQA